MDWTMGGGGPEEGTAGSLFVISQLKRTVEKSNRGCSASNIARSVFDCNSQMVRAIRTRCNACIAARGQYFEQYLH